MLICFKPQTYGHVWPGKTRTLQQSDKSRTCKDCRFGGRIRHAMQRRDWKSAIAALSRQAWLHKRSASSCLTGSSLCQKRGELVPSSGMEATSNSIQKQSRGGHTHFQANRFSKTVCAGLLVIGSGVHERCSSANHSSAKQCGTTTNETHCGAIASRPPSS